jgi:single-strand DNA-binding protein
MLNKVMLIGRLGRDPESRYTASGVAVCRYSLATSENYTDKNGEKQERTEWHNIVVFDRQAENCSEYLRKGSLIHIEGSIRTRRWETPEGETRHITEIVANRVKFLSRKPDETDEEPQQEPRTVTETRQYQYPGPAFPDEYGSGADDVPF